MKNKKYSFIVLMLVITPLLGFQVIAHPPIDMTLEYYIDTDSLIVTITHETPAPDLHYVNKIDIKKNDILVISEEYTSQPTNDVFSYTFNPNAALGDIIMVTAYCNIQGSITRTITIEDPTQDDPPEIEIKNPTKGYFHFSGIRLFATYLDLIYDTMGFGGFRVNPVQASINDDNDNPEDLIVTLYTNDIKERDMFYNEESELFEGKWIGPDLGVFTMKITAEDSSGNMGIAEMQVWYFCFIPEN
jgi:hypothetical protein